MSSPRPRPRATPLRRLLLVLLALAVACATNSTRTLPTQRVECVTAAPAPSRPPPQADSDTLTVGESPTLGRADALITVVEFGDFQCPFCARAEDVLARVRLRYGDNVRVVWKHQPLPFHDRAMEAAEASMEAYAQGGSEGFWTFHDTLLEHQDALSRTDLERYAEQQGLDLPRFRAALDHHTHEAAVRADMALASRVGAEGTPTFFINGTEIEGAQPWSRFRGVIDEVLARARGITPREQVYARMVEDPVRPQTSEPDAEPPSPPPAPTPQPGELDPNTVYRVAVGGSPSRGPDDALVTIVVFGDYQCPFCARAEATLDSLRGRYGNDLRVVWKHQPLPFHVNARPAAEAAVEALTQGGPAAFWRFHDALFQHQTDLDRTALERYAEQQGLDLTRFRRALDRHTHAGVIDADAALARSLEADGTPHFFINGVRLVGAQPEESFVRVIDAARSRAEEALRTPGTTRTNVYERLIANGATSPVHIPGGPPSAGSNNDDEGRVYTLAVPPRAPSRGPANAPVVIQVVQDFQCPFCSRVQPALEAVRARYGNRVRFVWRNYPLGFHDRAMPAAEAAMEAYAQGGNARFWRMHDTLYQHQRDLTRPDLERYAAQLGLNLPRFRAALDQHTHEATIRADMAAIDATGASIGTPSCFINGRLLQGAQPLESFVRVIDAALTERNLPVPSPNARPANRPGNRRP